MTDRTIRPDLVYRRGDSFQPKSMSGSHFMQRACDFMPMERDWTRAEMDGLARRAAREGLCVIETF